MQPIFAQPTDQLEPGESAFDSIGGAFGAKQVKQLRVVRHALQQNRARITDAQASATCTLAIGFLDQLIARGNPKRLELERKHIRSDISALERAAKLLRDEGAILATEAEEIADFIAESGSVQLESYHDCQQLQNRVQHYLTSLASPLAKLKTKPREVVAIYSKLADSFRTYRAEEEELEERMSSEYASLAEKTKLVDFDKFARYLGDFHFEKKLLLKNFDELTGGGANTTFAADVTGLDGPVVSRLVIRMNSSGGTTDNDVVCEAPLIKALHDRGFPVPELLWTEYDASRLGAKFLVMRRVDGQSAGGYLGPDPAVFNQDSALEVARFMGRLHALDPQELGLPSLTVHPMSALLEEFRGIRDASYLVPDGRLEFCLSWLGENKPQGPGRNSIIHADMGAHNWLVKDFKLAAVLDWELSHQGHPAEDLSLVRPFIEASLEWERFLAEYYRSGGTEYLPEDAVYYQIWSEVRSVVHILTSVYKFSKDIEYSPTSLMIANFYGWKMQNSLDLMAQL